MKNIEILIPTWPAARQRSEKLGLGTRYSTTDTYDSFWVPLRARPTSKEVYQYGDDTRIWQDIGLYVWMSADYGISIEAKAHEVHSGDVAYIEKLLKALKWINKRLEGMQAITPESLPFWLIDFCQRLGIKQTVRYQHTLPDTFSPVTDALQLLAAEITERHAGLIKMKAA